MKRTNLGMLSRRQTLVSAISFLAIPRFGFAKSIIKGSDARLWYERPAQRWEEALPLGNGRLGAMVFGRVTQERLQLNEDTLWAGAPYDPVNLEALGALAEVRALINQGRFKEATELASAKMMAKPLWQMAYGSLGDVFLNFEGTEAPSFYERDLNINTAISKTVYKTKVGRFVREAFVSAPDQAIVMRLKGPKSQLNFDIGYRGPRDAKHIEPNYAGAATELVPSESIDWQQTEAPDTTKGDIDYLFEGNDTLMITGHNKAGPQVAAGLTYALRIKVISDGAVTTTANGIKVQNASTATLLITAATSYVNYHDISGDPISKVKTISDAAAKKSYASLKADHIRDYQALFGRMSLNLGQTANAKLPTNERIILSETHHDPALSALYVNYARYLLISSSRKGTQPANLQGIWNEGTNPPWGSKYTININTEMNYWPADPSGLSACVDPLLAMVEDLAITGTKTAKAMYNARGWVAHHNTDIWRATAPIDGPMWGMWPCGGAWLCNTLWDHYDYTRDQSVLKRLYPLLKGAALFFLDTLVEDPKGRGLITSPSISPENQHPYGSSLCAGPAMDRQIIRDLFDHTISAAQQLVQDSELVAQIHRARARIAPDKIGKTGQLQEWLEDWDSDAPEQHHRHVSHLYGVYPSSQINVRDTPALINAAKTTLRQRGDLATGWGTAWRLCLWARMGDGEHAHSILRSLLGPQRTYPNMFDAHPPFQIDGNFGGAAGIMEMIVQSWGDEVTILPALPKAWPTGEVCGLRARGGLAVDLRWSKMKPKVLRITGHPNAPVSWRYDKKLTTASLDNTGQYEYHFDK